MASPSSEAVSNRLFIVAEALVPTHIYPVLCKLPLLHFTAGSHEI
ncbi:hypothetical protein [Prevotella sp. HJM029]|nr:hypothetical protein [Prevotella sp. HJM029]